MKFSFSLSEEQYNILTVAAAESSIVQSSKEHTAIEWRACKCTYFIHFFKDFRLKSLATVAVGFTAGEDKKIIRVHSDFASYDSLISFLYGSRKFINSPFISRISKSYLNMISSGDQLWRQIEELRMVMGVPLSWNYMIHINSRLPMRVRTGAAERLDTVDLIITFNEYFDSRFAPDIQVNHSACIVDEKFHVNIKFDSEELTSQAIREYSQKD